MAENNAIENLDVIGKIVEAFVPILRSNPTPSAILAVILIIGFMFILFVHKKLSSSTLVGLFVFLVGGGFSLIVLLLLYPPPLAESAPPPSGGNIPPTAQVPPSPNGGIPPIAQLPTNPNVLSPPITQQLPGPLAKDTSTWSSQFSQVGVGWVYYEVSKQGTNTADGQLAPVPDAALMDYREVKIGQKFKTLSQVRLRSSIPLKTADLQIPPLRILPGGTCLQTLQGPSLDGEVPVKNARSGGWLYVQTVNC